MSPRGGRGQRDPDLVDLRELREVFRRMYDLLEVMSHLWSGQQDDLAAKVEGAVRALEEALADAGIEAEEEDRAAPEG